jgi:LemA protein
MANGVGSKRRSFARPGITANVTRSVVRFSTRRLTTKLRALFSIRSRRRCIFALLVVGFLVHLVFLLYYNTFLSLQYDVEEARAQIDTQLQLRKNIILNLNVMVTGYGKHEKALFEYAADTRKAMLKPPPGTSPKEAPIPDQLRPILTGDTDTLLSKIFAIAERYPDLRLSENFQRFMDALVNAESKVAEERMVYNKRANMMSTTIGQFPGFIFAWLYGFEAPVFFEPEGDARKPPKLEY